MVHRFVRKWESRLIIAYVVNDSDRDFIVVDFSACEERLVPQIDFLHAVVMRDYSIEEIDL